METMENDDPLGEGAEFDPGNRLEASGFNADDASALSLVSEASG